MWAVCFIIVCIKYKLHATLILFSPGAIYFFPFTFPFIVVHFFYLFPAISLQLYFHWPRAKWMREAHHVFHYSRKTSNYTKSLKHNGGFHFGVVCVSFFFVRSHFVRRFCFCRFTICVLFFFSLSRLLFHNFVVVTSVTSSVWVFRFGVALLVQCMVAAHDDGLTLHISKWIQSKWRHCLK